MPARTLLADRNDLKLSIGLVTRLMALLHDVVEILYLPHDNWRIASAIDFIHGRLIGAALVHDDLLGYIVSLHGFVKKAHGLCLVALGGQKKVDRPDPFDLYVCFVHSPTDTDWPLVFTKDFFKGGQKPDRSAVDRRVVDKHAWLLHHFFQMAIAQRISRVSTDVHQNDIDRETHPFGRQHLVSSLFS